jgi:hypothetical protein
VFDPRQPLIARLAETCCRMTADAYRREMDKQGSFYDLLTRYAQAFMGVIRRP